MHPECRASLSIGEKLIQYYLISPGPVALTPGRVLVRLLDPAIHMLDPQ
jgi:hypothetical protein